MSDMKWNGKAFEQHLQKATSNGLLRAGTFYQSQCQRVVSKSAGPISVPIKRQTPGGNRRTRTTYTTPSKPGESPRARTGFGRKNIVMNHKAGRRPHARVGVTRNAMYMFHLEIGTRNIRRRPWLMKTLLENQEVIGKLAATGGKS
jgi:hypothetical protein